jgi:hypothetical protein
MAEGTPGKGHNNPLGLIEVALLLGAAGVVYATVHAILGTPSGIEDWEFEIENVTPEGSQDN